MSNNNIAINKEIYIEVLRIFAIFFVIFNHTGDFGFILFSKFQPSNYCFWIDMFWSIFCKFAVPVFFALSGALLIGKNESLKDLFTKRISKILTVLFFVSIIYYIGGSFIQHYDISFIKFFKNLYKGGIRIHLWYLYAYIAFLLTLPILRNIAKSLTKMNYIYITILSVIFFGIIPILEYLLFNNNLHLYKHINPEWICSTIFIYPLLGYFMATKVTNEEIKKSLPYLWGINIIAIIITGLSIYHLGSNLGSFASEKNIQIFHKNFAIINCICIFLTAKYFIPKININNTIQKIILSIGKCTFGIYLMHMLLKDILFMIFKSFVENNHSIIVAFVTSLIILALCYTFTLIIKRIPYIKKIFGY